MRRAGVSRAYAVRVMRELEDHSEDLGQRRDAGSLAHQLGDGCRLADACIEQYRSSRLCGRHPWVAFVLSPALVAALGLMVFLATSIPLFVGIGESGWVDQDSVARTLRTLALIGARGIPALFAVTFALLAVQSSLGARWIWSSGLILALLGASIQFRVDAPVPGHRAGEFALDLNLLQPSLLGFLLPLASALAFTLLDAWRRRSEGAFLHT